MKSQLSVIAEMGGRLALTPASYGMFSRRLPPFDPPRGEQEDHECCWRGSAGWASTPRARAWSSRWSRSTATRTTWSTRWARRGAVRRGRLASVRIAIDTYHMNIEETDPAAAILDAAPWIGHVQVSDSNRFQPGAGHLDWPACWTRWAPATPRARLECRLSTGGRSAAGRPCAGCASWHGRDPRQRRRPAVERQRLRRDADAVLIGNWQGTSTVPSRGLYPHQWSWDSAFIALGLRHCRRPGARRAGHPARRAVGATGGSRTSSSIRPCRMRPTSRARPSGAPPSPDGRPPMDTSGIIQPPVHAIAAAAVVRRPRAPTGRPSPPGLPVAGRAERLSPPAANRRPARLAAVVHPWETGMDNSPAWDAPLHAVPPTCRCSTPTPAATSTTRRPASGPPTRTTRATSGWPGVPRPRLRRRLGPAEGEFLRPRPGVQRLVGMVRARAGRACAESRRRRGAHLAEAARITAAGRRPLWGESRGLFLARDESPVGCCASGRWPD